MGHRIMVMAAFGLLISACSDDDGGGGSDIPAVGACIRFNDTLTEASTVSCDEEHVGKVLAVIDPGEECPAPENAELLVGAFQMGGKQVCYDSSGS